MAWHGMAPTQQRIEPSFDLSGGPWLGQAGGQPPPAPSFSLPRSHGLGPWVGSVRPGVDCVIGCCTQIRSGVSGNKKPGRMSRVSRSTGGF